MVGENANKTHFPDMPFFYVAFCEGLIDVCRETKQTDARGHWGRDEVLRMQ